MECVNIQLTATGSRGGPEKIKQTNKLLEPKEKAY
jgi:hypothetical protein